MASSQWQTFQPPGEDGIHRSPSYSQNNSQTKTSSTSLREAGIVEKLLHSYGFIRCCERQARLFFHYSQYSGNIEHLRLGDPVEFEMTYDRGTGKPIASSVVKMSPEALSGEVLSEECVSGFVTTEIKDGTEGRVAYENRGECFFLPYTAEDIEDPTDELKPGDKVTFQITTDGQTGNLHARNVRLENPHPKRYEGVVCALKDTFGFIERADIVKEIFFHSSECKDFKSLVLGDDVEFGIQSRNNKEVAVSVTRLPPGTVVFEDINPEFIMGQISLVADRSQSRSSSDPLPGRIRYRREDKEVEIPYGDKDPKGDYTLQVGDWVQFCIATDRRDQLQRATNIDLLDESFMVSGEKREKGTVAAVKETFGFISSVTRDSQLYFKMSELLDPDAQLKPRDEVEFTVTQDPSSPSRFQATRIRHRSSSEVSESILDKTRGRSLTNGDILEDGHILHTNGSSKESVSYSFKDCDLKNISRLGDRVELTSSSAKGTNQIATEGRIVGRGARNGFRYTNKGFIAALKDSFGFIETEEHNQDVFFHFSVFDGNPSNLELGQEVEFGLSHKGPKLSAECVRKIPNGTITPEEIKPDMLSGVVERPVRCFNPEQDEYAGIIRLNIEGENENKKIYEFGITSLTDKHDLLQKGDVVQFQIGVSSQGEERAMNVTAVRTRMQASVEAIKGHFGFLSYEAEEGKKLFFHMSEVKGGVTLQLGDKVEFIVVHNQRTGKYSACSVVKIGESQPSQRPERLISRLRTMSMEDAGPKVIVLRQPKGPDGTNGFSVGKGTEPAATATVTTNELDTEVIEASDTSAISAIDI